MSQEQYYYTILLKRIILFELKKIAFFKQKNVRGASRYYGFVQVIHINHILRYGNIL